MYFASKRLARLLALLLALTLVAAACGDDDDDDVDAAAEDATEEVSEEVAEETETESEMTEDTETESEDTESEMTEDTEPAAEEVSGSVVVSGSSTVEPISIAVAEKFSDAQPGVNVAVDGPGTGDGFQLFCAGDTDISDASRAIKEEEVATCEENGIEFVELKVGVDGISVLTNESNDAVECLTFADIYGLVGPESQGFDNWNDAEALAQELGSSTDLPDLPLDIVAPGEESGTYDTFVELVIEEFNEDRGAEAQTRPDYTASADDNVIIQGMQGSPGSFGWVGFAFAEEASGIKEIPIDDGESGCVEPTAETIASGEYPLSRPLFIYVNSAKAEENPAVEAYVDYYVSEEGIASVTEVGYVALDDEAMSTLMETWESKTTGTVEG